MPTGAEVDGLEQRMAPLPMRVVTTGICMRSASSVSSAQGVDDAAAGVNQGRSAFSMSSAACLTWRALPR